MGIVVLGAVFIDIKGHSTSSYIPAGRNVGTVEEVHGGVSRNVVEDIANVELRPKFVSLIDESGIGTGVLEKLNNHKVDTRFVRRTPDGMGKWLAVFDNHGDVVASISKRPDLSAINDILDEQGDEIFGDADSIALEIDMEKDKQKRPTDRGKTAVMREQPRTPASRPRDPRPRTGNSVGREAARKERLRAAEAEPDSRGGRSVSRSAALRRGSSGHRRRTKAVQGRRCP